MPISSKEWSELNSNKGSFRVQNSQFERLQKSKDKITKSKQT